MNLIEEILGNVNRAYFAMNNLPDTTLAAPPARLPPDYEEDTTAADTAYAWIRRCRESEEAAFSVMTEIEITEHGDFVKKAMHLLSNVGPYTDRNRLVNELVESYEGTMLACANHD